MGKFLNALLNKPSIQPSTVDPAAVGQPVPVAMLTEPPSDLTSESALNQAAVGAWPTLLDAGSKFWNGGWRQSVLREVTNQNVIGNYGSITSQSLFGFRYRAYAGVGNMPGPIPTPYRPTYNDLVPITWNLRVPNPNIIPMSTAQTGPIPVQTSPSTWLGTGTASVKNNGTTLL